MVKRRGPQTKGKARIIVSSLPRGLLGCRPLYTRGVGLEKSLPRTESRPAFAVQCWGVAASATALDACVGVGAVMRHCMRETVPQRREAGNRVDHHFAASLRRYRRLPEAKRRRGRRTVYRLVSFFSSSSFFSSPPGSLPSAIRWPKVGDFLSFGLTFSLAT